MRLKLFHKTEYTYDASIEYGLQRLRLTPQSRSGQSVINWDIKLDGAVEEATYEDHNRNTTKLISIVPGARTISIEAFGEVETQSHAGVVGAHNQYPPLWLFRRDTFLTKRTPAIVELAREATDEDEIARMHELMHLIGGRVAYLIGATDAKTTADEALTAGQGVCQDHSHIFVAAARAQGFPARYVSGYLMMDGQNAQSASHAWAEVYIDKLGWVGFDASNQISPDERYVGQATGLDYREAAPISGIRHGFALESLAVEVHIEQ